MNGPGVPTPNGLLGWGAWGQYIPWKSWSLGLGCLIELGLDFRAARGISNMGLGGLQRALAHRLDPGGLETLS